MGTILDGRALAEEIKSEVKKDVEKLNRLGIDVGIALLFVGEDPASKQYFKTIVGACGKIGITAYEYRLPATVRLNEILNVVHSINADERIRGLLILMPLPAHINARRVINSIVAEKDVDGLGAISVGRLAADESTFQLFRRGSRDMPQYFNLLPALWSFLPCTPYGVIRLLEHHKVEIKGKHAVIIGKSLAVGKPLSMMFLAKEATVTVCHRETQELAHFTRQADILCSATGKAGLITDGMVKNGAVVVDIGINMLKDGTIIGDVDFNPVAEKASMITPVPGGVGPVTIAMLLENTVRSAQRNEMVESPLMIV